MADEYEHGDSPPPRRHGDEHGDGGRDYENGDKKKYRDDDDDRVRERDRDRSRHKDDSRDRDRDRERRHRDDRDRGRDDRDRGRDDRGRGSRDHDDRRGDRRHSRRSRSRSRSRSRDRRSSKRTTGFDMAPPGAPLMPTNTIPVPFSGVQQPMPGMFGGMPMPGMVFPGFGGVTMPAQAMMAGQATRHARRVYVGGLPPMANEQSIAAFFSQVMQAIGGNTANPVGDAVVNVYINQEKKFAFVEFRTVEEASNAMALDGINYEGVAVRVRRPSDYNPSMAATLGPSQPSPHLNLAAVGLTPGGSTTGGADGPDRIFVGGLPYYLTEDQIKELLSAFGPLRAFDLVKDRDTGNSKGYGFCVYQDPNVVDIACASLNGMKIGDKTLTVRRATASGQPKPDQANMLQQAQQQIALQQLALTASGANNIPLGGMPGVLSNLGLGSLVGAATEVPTRVVMLAQVISANELQDDEEYEEIKEDMREECGKYGTISNLVIPRPKMGEDVPGVGKVFVEYSDTAGSSKAKGALNGRKFGSNVVIASFYPESKFACGEFGG